MYPEEEEFNLDEQALLDVQEFCSGRTDEKPHSLLNFTLTISLHECNGDGGRENSIDLSCYFPQEYPNSKPELFVRSQSLNRETQRELNEKLKLSYNCNSWLWRTMHIASTTMDSGKWGNVHCS